MNGAGPFVGLGGEAVVGEERAERDGAEAGGRAAEKSAPRELLGAELLEVVHGKKVVEELRRAFSASGRSHGPVGRFDAAHRARVRQPRSGVRPGADPRTAKPLAFPYALIRATEA